MTRRKSQQFHFSLHVKINHIRNIKQEMRELKYSGIFFPGHSVDNVTICDLDMTIKLHAASKNV